MNDPTPESHGRGRRALLAGAAGAGGLLLAAATAGPAQAAPHQAAPVLRYDTVRDLLAARHPADGAVAVVAGYHSPGDGGGGGYRWDAGATRTGNGGTVLDPARGKARRGRWLALHTGTVDFRRFGVTGPTTNADTALDAMVTDPSIARIEAHTDLNFVRRHTFSRSRIELDFGGHTVTTKGIEEASHDPDVSPFQAVLYFRGAVAKESIRFTTTEAIAELSDVFPVADSASFTVGGWYAVEVNALSGQYERELQKLLQVTQRVDGTHVRVNYQNGWPFAAGRTFTWTKVEPVTDVRVGNLAFVGSGGTPYAESDWPKPDPDEWNGSHPFAFEYAVRCDVADVHAVGTFWPVVMRRWGTFFRTERCSIANPPTVFYGGAGYLTQNIYCLYGHVEDCHSSNARHLTDFVNAAYCYVTNCHGDGDDAGGNPFTTHGQYEHDLVFTGCSGLMDIANSGSAWGTAAKRFTIRRHVMSWFVASTRISDLTLEDVTVIPRSTFDPDGKFMVNADGLQLRGCSAKTFAVAKTSSRSSRPNVISGCTFEVASANVLVQTPVDVAVHFDRCTFTDLSGVECHGSGPVYLTDCTITGTPGGKPISFAGTDVVVSGGRYTDTGFVLTATRDQRLHIGGGARIAGTNAAKALISRSGGDGTIDWELADYDSSADDGTAHVALATGTNRYTAVGSRFAGGTLSLSPQAFRGDSYLLQTGCVESGVDRTAYPPAGDRVHTGTDLTV
ncbi:hypothetical protein [Actinocatenispora comari]|uniref:Peptidase C14 n=1 Tax=Actinocatenispora comari TaxID=2807577 RepID=A0A8J4A885_9ACTN|nr:hypothetical protein [Actinocatenispora comari]GIL25130.1 hypothetical protein NUM_03850 [Actinocatenispora comari]